MESFLVGEKTGLVAGKPLPASEETKAAFVNASQSNSISHSGNNTSATDLINEEKKVKSEKESTNYLAIYIHNP
jgi:hypothetical protein